MTTTRAPWLADVLRAEGLTAVEHGGWKTRGAAFADLRAVVWHHDASAPGDSPNVPAYMLGQIAKGKPGAQLWVDRHGAWHVLASGKVSHAGRVRAGKPGNGASLGVETDHTTGEDWPVAQLYSLRRGTAAILRHLLVSTSTGLEFHKTICSPAGRKSDPAGLDLDDERVLVDGMRSVKPALTTTPPAPTHVQEDDMALLITDAQAKRVYLVSPLARTKRWLSAKELALYKGLVPAKTVKTSAELSPLQTVK